ncbi:hypothetical protein HD806DRAFT_521310 [Xylariaceae sp. AK1471]|nr:hypothetical protein HD806DRAFT_521310 [Xylariaceae sp. AK1471]
MEDYGDQDPDSKDGSASGDPNASTHSGTMSGYDASRYPNFLDGSAYENPNDCIYTDPIPKLTYAQPTTPPKADVEWHDLYMIIPPPTTVWTGQYFFVVALILPKASRMNEDSPYIVYEGTAGCPEAIHYRETQPTRQLNTTMSLVKKQITEEREVGFLCQKPQLDSPCEAGTYVVYKLKRDQPGEQHLRLQVYWDLHGGRQGHAYYNAGIVNALDAGGKSYDPVPVNKTAKGVLLKLCPYWGLPK